MSDFRFGTIAYLPPLNIANTASFVTNIQRFKAKHPLLFFGWQTKVEGLDIIPLHADPEFFKGKGRQNRLALPNAVFYVGLKIAQQQGWTHFMFLEADCRVGCDDWDDAVWQEYLQKCPDTLMAGSPRVFNGGSFSREVSFAFEKYLADTHPRHFPIAQAGTGRLDLQQPVCVFPNGALAIYKVDWLWGMFEKEINGEFNKLVMETHAWDYEIGIRAWNNHKVEVFQKVGCLTKAYSDFGNLLYSEDERKQMLLDGTVTCVHQIKTHWDGPERPAPWKPRTGLIWVTYGKDLEWFKFSAASYKKFASGFDQAVCVVPKEDEEAFRPVCEANGIQVIGGDQWPENPFNWHQCQKCCADIHMPEAQVIFHVDADVVFAQPCTPMDWMVGRKILMPYTPYKAFLKRPIGDDEAMAFMGFNGKKVDFNLGQYNWKFAVEFALGHPVERECMAWAPLAHYKEVYERTRELITARFPDRGFDGYVRSCRGTHPQQFAEFNTLGAVAHAHFENCYEWYNLEGRPYPFYGKVVQVWSHGGLDRPHDFGPQVSDPAIDTPRKFLASIGLLTETVPA